MKKLYIIFIISAQIMFLSGILNAADSKIPESLTAVNSTTFPPFSFMDDDEVYKGILVDFWNLWSKKTGISLKFTSTTWSKSLEDVLNGTADFHSGLFMTEDRISDFDFSDPFFRVKSCLFIQSSFEIKNIKSLDNLKIGATPRTSATHFFKKKYNSIPVIMYSDSRSAINAAVKGSIDAFVTDEPIARFYLSKEKALGSFRLYEVLYEEQIRAGVKNGNFQLLKKINKGLSLITSYEIEAIEKKWMVDDSYNILNDWRFYSIAGGGISGVFIILLMILGINKTLKKTISEKTESLERELNERKKIEHHLVQAQKMELAGILARGIVHDMKNVLSGITGPVSILEHLMNRDGIIKEEDLVNNLKMINSSVSRAIELSYNLENFRKKKEIKFKAVDLNDSVKTVAGICRAAYGRQINVADYTIDKKCLINGDESLLEQILLNICINGIHAMTIMDSSPKKQKGTLKIDVIYNENMKHGICIADEGVGMSEEVQKKIKEPFFTTKDETQGTGLGMTMVDSLVKDLNGTIDVKSELGKGTAFVVMFPVIAG